MESMLELLNSHTRPLDSFELHASRVTVYLFWSFALVAVLGKVMIEAGTGLPDFSDFFRIVGLHPMNASGLAAAIILFFCARPTAASCKVVLVLGLLFEAYYFFHVLAGFPFQYRVSVAGPGLALAGVLGLVYQSAMDSFPPARLRARAMLRVAGIMAMYPLVGEPCLAFLSWSSVEVYDPFGYTVEGCLGFWPCNEVALFLSQHPWLDHLLAAIYARLPVFVMLGFAINLVYSERCYTNVFFTFIASGLAAWAFYPLLPMVGVEDYVGRPPYPSPELPTPVPLQTIPAPAHLPRTCFPSMHGTWILLPFFTVKRVSRWWAWFFGIITFLTIVATVHALVGHYFLDVVASFPFTVLFLALLARKTARNRTLRWRIAGLCLGFTVVMALGIRYFTPQLAAYPYLTWGVFLAGILGSIWLEEILARASLDNTDSTEAQSA